MVVVVVMVVVVGCKVLVVFRSDAPIVGVELKVFANLTDC